MIEFNKRQIEINIGCVNCRVKKLTAGTGFSPSRKKTIAAVQIAMEEEWRKTRSIIESNSEGQIDD